MRTFCTIFDKNYLVQGVALYNSLKRFSKEFKLYALCMDPLAFEMITKMNLEHFIPIAVEELLSPEVRQVRKRTSYGQFCWVCQPLVCQFILDKFQVDMVTYLEADSLFFADPQVLFEELADKSVSIVPHNFSPGFESLAVGSGKFCVQFNAFKNNNAARKVLDHWREACFKYNEHSEVFPGQLCLDDWPERFDCVKVIKNPGAGVAPWNIQHLKFKIIDGVRHVDSVPVIFYHFHGYGRHKNGDHALSYYPLGREVVLSFYSAYVDAIRKAETMVQAVDHTFTYRKEYADIGTFWGILRSFLKATREHLGLLRRRKLNPYSIVPESFFTKVSAGDKP